MNLAKEHILKNGTPLPSPAPGLFKYYELNGKKYSISTKFTDSEPVEIIENINLLTQSKKN